MDTKYAEVAKYYSNVAIYDDGTLGSEYKTGEYTIINSRPTLCSCLRAIIMNIATSCPTARIIGNSIMRPNNTLESIDPVVVSKRNAIVNTYMQYGVPVADMWNEMSVNTYNFNHYYIDGVHPNALGGERMASIISHKL